MAIRSYLRSLRPSARASARENDEVRRLREQVARFEIRLKVVEADYERRQASSMKLS